MTISVTAALFASVSFFVAAIWAGVTDLLTMRIRNSLVLFLLGVYAALAPLTGWTAAEIGMSVAVAAAVLGCSFACFAAGWIGGGDAKLVAVIVLWLGAEHVTSYLLGAALFGGGLTLMLLRFRMMTLPAFCLRVPWITRLHDRRSGVPYGVALAAAAVLVFPDTLWVKALS
ncbi:prepilin peptidase [Microvirga sp. BT689]|uniref:A24 family peptidase n=1 Tax=Microvirga arvi TaxID=2778731 RepID=UPI00194DCB09|nr:prepilin peptidase [Microvirga arvi]MBM6583665.1 prepilin peptidase [Microvirga arvi]